MSLGHENKNIDALHRSIALLQNELTEKNKMIKSLKEIQTAVLDVMADLDSSWIIQNRTWRNIYRKTSLIKDLKITEKIFKRRPTQNKSASWKKKKIIYVGNLHEDMTESDLVELSGLRTMNCSIDDCSIEMSLHHVMSCLWWACKISWLGISRP